MIVETKQMMFVSSFIHSFISPQNVIAKKEFKKQNLTKLN